jgi:hypothetical protein
MASASACVGFTLPGMIEEPGSLEGMMSSANPARGPHDIRRMSFARYGERTQRARQLHQGVVGPLNRELVRCAHERQIGKAGDFPRSSLAEPGLGIQAGTDRGPADGEPIDSLERILETLKIVGEHAGVTRPLLTERDRGGILHVGAADLDDVLPFAGLVRDGIVQLSDSRHETPLHPDGRRHVHGRGERIIRGLRHVDVVVRMNRPLAAERRACELAATVRDDLIHVHVELRATAGHPLVQRKHVVMLPREDLIAHPNDEVVLLVVETPFVVVYLGGSLLQGRVRHLARNQIGSDAEMFERCV